jgi:hypothetical protein
MDGSPDPRPRRLALIEVVERDGRIGRVVEVGAWPVQLGRAFDNDVVLDDPHLAPHHARLQPGADGALELLPLPSANGVLMDGRRLQAGAPVPDGGALLQLGATRLRLRLPGEALAPEVPLAAAFGGSARRLVGLALALLALRLATLWVQLDPGTDTTDWLPEVLTWPAIVIGWCGAWGLLSKLFQHRFDFMGHLRIALPWMLGITVFETVWPPLCATLDAPGLWKLGVPIKALMVVLMIHAHLRHLLPMHRRMVAATVIAFALVGTGVRIALNLRATDSLSASPYMSTLPLPGLRLGGTVPVGTLVDDLQPLTRQLAERASSARADEADESGEAD